MLSTLSEIVRTTLQAVKQISGKEVLGNDDQLKISGNLIELMDDFIIEPLIIVTDDLKREPITESVIGLQVDMFVTYVTTAFDILLNVYGLKAEKVIAAMTNKTLDMNQLARFGYESLATDIETPLPLFDMESDTFSSKVNNLEVKEITYKNKNGKDIKFKIMIRPTIEYVDNDTVIKLLIGDKVDKSFFNRLDKFEAGLIDKSAFFFNTDLMEEYKRNRLKDDSDILKVINDRKISSDIARVSAGVPNMSEYYQMIIISATVRKEVEIELGKKLIKPGYSKRVMHNSRSLTLTALDDIHERCLIFVNGIKGHTDISFKSLNKTKNNSELTEVLKFLLNK